MKGHTYINQNYGKLVIGADAYLMNDIMQLWHGNTNGGHSGMENTYKRLDTLFYKKNLREDINMLESVHFIKELNMMPQELLAAYNLWLSPSPHSLALAWIL